MLQRYSAEPLFVREFQILAAERGLQVIELGGSRPHPQSVLRADRTVRFDRTTRRRGGALRWWIPDLSERDVFLFGPTT